MPGSLFRLLPLLGLLSAPSLAATSASSHSPYAFDAAQFPRYDLSIALDGRKPALTARGEVAVPRSLIRDDAVIFALTEAARQVEIELIGAGGRRQRVDVAIRMQAQIQPPFRRWTLLLPRDWVTSGGPVRIAFKYRIEQAPGNVFALTPRVSFVSGTNVAWYPQVERADGVRMPGVGSMSVDAGDRIVVSGSRSVRGRRHIADSPRQFAFSAAPYRVVTGRSGHARLYLLAEHPDAAAFADRMDALIPALEAVFGPMPQAHFDLAEVPTALAREAGFDGASLDGFMLAADFYFDQPFNTAFFGHELGHQWWGTLVRRRGSSGQYLLDESLAQFGSLAAVSTLEGERAAERYRRRGFAGYYAEYSGFSFLARSLAGIDTPLTSLPADDGFIARRVANSKGMIVWSMLADTMGPTRFAAFLESYVRSNAYGWVTLEDFVAALRSALGEQAWFIDEWLNRMGAPEYRLAWTVANGELGIRLSQEPQPYRALVPIEIRLRDGSTLQRLIDARSAETELSVQVASDVIAVTLDPAYRVLRWTPEYRAEAAAILPYTRADIALNYGRNDDAAADIQAALTGLTGVDTFGLRARLERGMGDAELSRNTPQEAIAHYLRALAADPQVPEQLPELLLSLADAYRLAGDERAATATRTRAAEATRKLWAD
jgi:Peptidase family M1 domain